MAEGIKYWIPKYRYYELKYYCLQYPHFKELINREDISEEVRIGVSKAIDNIEAAVTDVKCTFSDILLKSVTDGTAYSKIPSEPGMPSPEEYFDAYRKFFYYLSKRRGV